VKKKLKNTKQYSSFVDVQSQELAYYKNLAQSLEFKVEDLSKMLSNSPDLIHGT